MKRIILLSVFLLFPLIAYAQPSIGFEAETYDFGSVEKGDAIEHTFIVTNNGNEELFIKELVTS